MVLVDIDLLGHRCDFHRHDRNAAYTYNANGDVLNDGTHTYSYDFEDHLIGSGTGGNQTATYAYDADGNRIQKIDGTGTTNYLVDSNRTYAEVLEERDGSGNILARYDYGDDLIRMDRGSVSRYYLFDGLGSTRQLTDGTGAVTDTYAYDAFGNLTAQTGSTVNPYLFNGQEQDAGTGLYYLRERYMSPADGRFISQDPYGGDNEDPISLHRYLYASANPVNRVDPSGALDLGETLVAIGEQLTLHGINATFIGVLYATGGSLYFAGTGGSPIIGALVGFELGSSLSFAQDTDRGWIALGSAAISGVIQGLVDLGIGFYEKKFVGPGSDDYIHKMLQHIFEAAASGAASVAFGSFKDSTAIAKAYIAGGITALQDILDDANDFFEAKDQVQLLIDDIAQASVDFLVSYGVTKFTANTLDQIEPTERQWLKRFLKNTLHRSSKKLVEEAEEVVEVTIEGVVGIITGNVVGQIFEPLKSAAAKGP